MSSAGSVDPAAEANARDEAPPVDAGMEDGGDSLAMNLRDSNMDLLMDW